MRTSFSRPSHSLFSCRLSAFAACVLAATSPGRSQDTVVVPADQGGGFVLPAEPVLPPPPTSSGAPPAQPAMPAYTAPSGPVPQPQVMPAEPVTGGNSAATVTGGMESPGTLPTSLFIPEVAQRGANYVVSPTVVNDGLSNTYTLTSTDGNVFEITGTQFLYERMREVDVTVKLRTLPTGKEFASGIGNDAKNKLGAVGRDLEDPARFFESIPKGASRFFGSLGEDLTTRRDEYQGRAYSAVLGETRSKALLAFRVGVDPYSTNHSLQKQLNRVGWSEALGKLTFDFALSSALPFGAGLGLDINQDIQQILSSQPPEQLIITNTKRLMAVGVSKEVAYSLVKHPWFSPAHSTVITESLVALGPGVNQTAFINRAITASNEIDARYFEHMAQLIRYYGETQSPVQQIMAPMGPIVFSDNQGNTVFPVPFDYAPWTSRLKFAVERLLASQSANAPLVVVTTGYFSPRATEELQGRGVRTMTKVKLPTVTPAKPY